MAQEITIEELERNTSPKRVIDIRSREAFEKGAFPFAENIPLEELKPEIIAADTTMPVYLFCHTGRLSMDVADDLEDLGCEAYSVKGGYHSYLKPSLTNSLTSRIHVSTCAFLSKPSLYYGWNRSSAVIVFCIIPE